MRMHVLYDTSGQILAAVELSERDSEDTLQVRPVAKSDQYTADLDVPPAQAHLSFKDVCETLVVDVDQKAPRLRSRT